MTNFAYVILAIFFVVTNIIWIGFLRWLLSSFATERWQLQERIREPNAEHVPIGDLIARATEGAIAVPDPNEPIFKDEKPDDEIDLVNQINPDTPLREDEG